MFVIYCGLVLINLVDASLEDDFEEANENDGPVKGGRR